MTDDVVTLKDYLAKARAKNSYFRASFKKLVKLLGKDKCPHIIREVLASDTSGVDAMYGIQRAIEVLQDLSDGKRDQVTQEKVERALKLLKARFGEDL